MRQMFDTQDTIEYDVESGLYYCITRYYSPELCIFTSIDSIEYLDCESINGLDLYCYCLNNPISFAYNSSVSNVETGIGTYYAGIGVGKAAVGLGIVAGGAAITYLGVGFAGALAIGGGVAVVVGIAGAVAIYYLGELLDYGWSELKKALFE